MQKSTPSRRRSSPPSPKPPAVPCAPDDLPMDCKFPKIHIQWIAPLGQPEGVRQSPPGSLFGSPLYRPIRTRYPHGSWSTRMIQNGDRPEPEQAVDALLAT